MDGPIADINGVKLFLNSLLNACTFRISIFKRTPKKVWPYWVDIQMCSSYDIYSTTSCLSCIGRYYWNKTIYAHILLCSFIFHLSWNHIPILTTGFWGKEAWRPPTKWNTRFFFAFSKRTQLWLVFLNWDSQQSRPFFFP